MVLPGNIEHVKNCVRSVGSAIHVVGIVLPVESVISVGGKRVWARTICGIVTLLFFTNVVLITHEPPPCATDSTPATVGHTS
jgi:hypothetical protein